MADFNFTSDTITALRAMPAGKRAQALEEIGKLEWAKCADDIFYWLDPTQHPIPYVFTKDPHPMYKCLWCNDNATYHFNKRKHHMLHTHTMDVATEKDLKLYFQELDTTRVLELLPYFRPIIEAWLEHPLMAIEKSRDMMATWLVVLCYGWDTMFHKGRQNIFQSETGSKTRELLERVMFVYNNQPAWLKNVVPVKFNAGVNKVGRIFVPKLESELLGFAQGATQIRQYHPTGFFSDEAAFNPEAGDCFMAIKPAIQNGGRYTAVSSANPSFFQRICRDTTNIAE